MNISTYYVDKIKFYVVYFCKVLIDRGKVLEDFIKNLNPKVSKAALAKKLGYDRSTLYLHFANPNLDYSVILKYGKALKHDFSVEFPDMFQYISTVEEPLAEYKVMSVSEALRERDYWKDKYINLMERYNELIMAQLEKKLI